MQLKYAEKGLQIIAINLDTVATLAKTFLNKVPALVPIVYDPRGKIAIVYQLLGMPSSYLIDKKGLVVSQPREVNTQRGGRPKRFFCDCRR